MNIAIFGVGFVCFMFVFMLGAVVGIYAHDSSIKRQKNLENRREGDGDITT